MLQIRVADCIATFNICFIAVAIWRDDKVKVKVKVTLEQATKAQKGSRSIALLFT